MSDGWGFGVEEGGGGLGNREVRTHDLSPLHPHPCGPEKRLYGKVGELDILSLCGLLSIPLPEHTEGAGWGWQTGES